MLAPIPAPINNNNLTGIGCIAADPASLFNDFLVLQKVKDLCYTFIAGEGENVGVFLWL